MSSNNFINLCSSESDYVGLDRLELIKEISNLPNKTDLKDILENKTITLFVNSISKLLNKKSKLEELLNPDEFEYYNYSASFHNIFTNLLDVYEIKLSIDDNEDNELPSICIQILNTNSFIYINYDYDNSEINVFLTENEKDKLLITLDGTSIDDLYRIYSLIKINIYLRKGNKTEISENIYIYKGIESFQYNPSEEIVNILMDIITDINYNSSGDLTNLENLIKNIVTLLKNKQ